MERTIAQLNIAWSGRLLRAALLIFPLWLSGCNDYKTSNPPVDNFPMRLAVSVSGNGSVTINPAGINCGSDCTETLASGSTVTLTAIPSSGFTFTGWSGDCSGSALSCDLTMSASRAVTASFATTSTSTPTPIPTASPTPTPTPTASPTPTPTPPTPTRTPTPSPTPSPTPTPTPTPTPSPSPSPTPTPTPAPTPTPTPVSYMLTVSKNGSGVVTSGSAEINCGVSCSAAFASNTVVTLTAAPAPGYNFTGWSGACSNMNCSVTMSRNQAVTATFTAVTSNGTAQLMWDAPTTNADGSTLTNDLGGYTLRYGTAAGNYTLSIDLPLNVATCSATTPTTCGYTVNGLSAGTWYFAVQAYDAAGNVSIYSNEAMKAVP